MEQRIVEGFFKNKFILLFHVFFFFFFFGSAHLLQALDKMISDEKPNLDDLFNKANTLYENCGNKEVLNKAEKAKKDYDMLNAKLQVCILIYEI